VVALAPSPLGLICAERAALSRVSTGVSKAYQRCIKKGLPMDMEHVEVRRVAREISQRWWAWLVVGILWIIVALVILRFTAASVVTVGIIVGVLFCVSGIEELLVARVSGEWRWLAIVFGIILLIGGVLALFRPVTAFLALADILGFVFVLIGIFWIVEALTTQEQNPMWGLGLVAGIIMIGLGFATDAKLLPTRAYMLLVLAGIWALLRGITDIVRAFQIRHLGAMVTSNVMPGATGATGPAATGPMTQGPIPPQNATPRATS